MSTAHVLPRSVPNVAIPPSDFLADVYRKLPFMVVHLTTDGTVLHCNPETARLTGYQENELLGRNFWGLLFPGKLFAQVPRFISLLHPEGAAITLGAGSPLLKDVPMTLRTRDGRRRVVAFTRHSYTPPAGGTGDPDDSSRRTFICIGVDLTDRLVDADRAAMSGLDDGPPGTEGAPLSFGPHIGNAGTIDSEIITPIAISPMAPRGAVAGSPEARAPGCCSVDQVREGLARMETHMSCLQAALDAGEHYSLEAFASLRRAGPDLGQSLVFLARGDWLALAPGDRVVGSIRARVDELLTLCRPDAH